MVRGPESTPSNLIVDGLRLHLFSRLQFPVDELRVDRFRLPLFDGLGVDRFRRPLFDELVVDSSRLLFNGIGVDGLGLLLFDRLGADGADRHRAL